MTNYFPRRARKGPWGGAACLSHDDVRTIRRMADDHPEWSAAMIADDFPGLSVETIRRVIRRDTHRNVPDTAPGQRAAPLAATPDQAAMFDMVRQAQAQIDEENRGLGKLQTMAKRFPSANRLLDEMDQPPTEVAPKNPLDETEDDD